MASPDGAEVRRGSSRAGEARGAKRSSMKPSDESGCSAIGGARTSGARASAPSRPEEALAPAERGALVRRGGAERVLAARAVPCVVPLVRKSAMSQSRGVGGDAREAEDVGGDRRDRGRGAAPREVDAAGAREPGESGDVRGLEAREVEREGVEGLGRRGAARARRR